MFHLAQNFLNWVQVRREYRATITVLGINNAGKTSILNIIRGAPDTSVAPTTGFNKHDIEQGNLKLTFFDLGGGPKIRNTWANYFARAHGIIFVVDASDPNSFVECKKVFDEAVGHSLLDSKPFLILANKNDVAGSVDAAGIRAALGLSANSSFVRVQNCSTSSKPSIDEGSAWLYQSLVSHWRTLSPRVEADVAAEEQKMREAFAERKRQVELKKAQRLKDEETRLAAEALQAATSEVTVQCLWKLGWTLTQFYSYRFSPSVRKNRCSPLSLRLSHLMAPLNPLRFHVHCGLSFSQSDLFFQAKTAD
jgi:small GTP-binding protein